MSVITMWEFMELTTACSLVAIIVEARWTVGYAGGDTAVSMDEQRCVAPVTARAGTADPAVGDVTFCHISFLGSLSDNLKTQST